MFGLAGIGLIAFVVDYILQQIVQKKSTLNIIGAIILVYLLIAFL